VEKRERKTDKDDSLKLAKLTALDQIVAVHVPTSENRQYRHLVKYRKVLVGRVNTVQNELETSPNLKIALTNKPCFHLHRLLRQCDKH
jgi:transposase